MSLQAPPAVASASGVRWDLSSLFTGTDDPAVEQTWNRLFSDADAFATRFREGIDSDSLTAQQLVTAIRTYESIVNEASKPMAYAHLLFSADTSDPKIGAYLQRQQEHATELNVRLLFFELELQRVKEETVARLLTDPVTANYRHYVTSTRAFSAYRLSEPEEVILEEVSNTGSRAWIRFFEELTSNQEYSVRLPNASGPQTSTQEAVLALLRHADRAVRQAGADAFSEGLESAERQLVFVFNTLLQDKFVEDRLRGFVQPETSRHLANELDGKIVDLVVGLCHSNYEAVARYYRVKRQILGLKELTHVDRYAPLFEAERTVTWPDGKTLVLDSFGAFHPEMRSRANEFFEQNWIDAEPRSGKRGGAFCSYVTPDTHPFVQMTYQDKPDDVMTLAHELGHGVHASLSREQTLFGFHGTLPLAELASTFGEMLVFERLVGEADPRDRIALYAEKIEGVFATVFRQAAMYRFEQRCHRSRREHGELSAEAIGDLWQEEIQTMFGDSVSLGAQHRRWWSYVGHFIHTPFYVYAYSFGELLVLSLFQRAKDEGPEFAGRYISLLRLGGSKTPQELMASVGVDLQDAAFWQGGITAIKQLISEFEKLWEEYSKGEGSK